MANPRLLRLARALLFLTIVYNVAEGVVAIVAGIRAGSLVLISFGADSYLEVMAAAAVLWRLSFKDEESGERAEEKALRLIGATFLLLATAVTYQAAISLTHHDRADGSPVGVILLLASVTMMPILAVTKLWTAARGAIPALAAEARETIACSYLSFTALTGAGAVWLFGWWWLDALAALLMVPWLVKEGFEGLKGEACFDGTSPCWCRGCLLGLRQCAPTCCEPVCC